MRLPTLRPICIASTIALLTGVASEAPRAALASGRLATEAAPPASDRSAQNETPKVNRPDDP